MSRSNFHPISSCAEQLAGWLEEFPAHNWERSPLIRHPCPGLRLARISPSGQHPGAPVQDKTQGWPRMEIKAPRFPFFKGLWRGMCVWRGTASSKSSARLQELRRQPIQQPSPQGVSPTAPPPRLPEVVFLVAPEERQATRLSLATFYTPRVTS